MSQTEIEQIGEQIYFISSSAASRRLRMQAELLSQTDVPLLITGEPGTGKSTAARFIHSLSRRSRFPFTQLNCAALTADTLERELFGYENVMGNGRIESRPGKFEQKGTILLQNFDTMASAVQIRLLKLLEANEFVRVGGTCSVRADVRIIAASETEVEEVLLRGHVSEELYNRLSAFKLAVPPLRERCEDVPQLLGHFISRLTPRYGITEPRLSEELLQACQQYSWPGNLRQLEIFAKRLLVFGDEAAALEELKALAEGEMPKRDYEVDSSAQPIETSSLKSLVRHAKGETERNAIAHALEETHWNRKAAARLLNISYRALLYKIHEYQVIRPEQFSGPPLPKWTPGNGS